MVAVYSPMAYKWVMTWKHHSSNFVRKEGLSRPQYVLTQSGVSAISLGAHFCLEARVPRVFQYVQNTSSNDLFVIRLLDCMWIVIDHSHMRYICLFSFFT